jgi:outer membrane protein assembly factor BamB
VVGILRRKLILFLVCSQLIVVCLPFIQAQSGEQDWPMYHHDAARSGFSSASAPTTSSVKWVATAGGGASYTSPVIVNGMIYLYVNTTGNTNTDSIDCLYATNGTQKWRYSFSGNQHVSPTVANGKVYAVTSSTVDCVNSNDGHRLWSSPIVSSWSSSLAIVNGRIYGITNFNEVYCLNAINGTLLWKSNRMGSYTTWYSAPAIAEDKVFVGSWDKKVYCFNAITGSQLWNHSTGSAIEYSPAVANGKVYISAGMGLIQCLNAVNGTQIWSKIISFNGTYMFSTAPAIAYGNVYVGIGHIVQCINLETGNAVWNYSLPAGFEAPTVAENKVYIGADSTTYCIDAIVGTLIWSYDTGTGGGPPAIADGCLYRATGATTENLYCFGPTNNHLPTTPTITGPSDGIVNTLYTFTISGATDPDGEQVKYGVDWDGNGVVDQWTEFVNSGETVQVTHTWTTKGIYGVKVRAQDTSRGQSELSPPQIITVTNNPPQIPNSPDGPTTGVIEIDYAYTITTISDPDGDTVKYGFNWTGGDNVDEWTDFYVAGFSIPVNHRWMTPGAYQIRVKASDGLKESSWSNPLTVTIATQPTKQLVIMVNPSAVLENTNFVVTITADNIVIDHAAVTFLDSINYTNSNGVTMFIAPMVDEDTAYVLTANLDGYHTATKSIIILNQKEQTSDAGWIYGIVSNGSSLLAAAQLTISSGEKSWSVYTDENGQYVISVPVGTYTLIASKQGYKSDTTTNVIVVKNTAIEENFILIIEENPTPGNGDTSSGIVETMIRYQATQGVISAKLQVDSQAQTIQYYSDAFNINIMMEENIVSFTVSADTNTKATILVVRIGGGTLTDTNDLTVTYDATKINEVTDVETFFDLIHTTDPSWLRVATAHGVYVFIKVPHFSEHTITISSVAKVLNDIMAQTMLFLGVTTVALVLFFVPVYLLYYKKPKE